MYRIMRSLCYLCLFSYVSTAEASNEEEGDRCRVARSRRLTGICTKVDDCPPARAALERFRNHDLTVCGFDGFDQLVCCPEEELNIIPVSRPTVHPTFDGPVWTDEPSKPFTPDSGSPDDIEERHAKRRCVQACDRWIKLAKPNVAYHIIEGENAERGEFPHMAALGYQKPGEDEIKWNCGGTLISQRFVLTAAHCILNIEKLPPSKVRMGIINLKGPYNDSDVQDFDVENITIYPDYKWAQKINDIALVKLDRDADFTSTVFPACLYTKDDDPIGLVVTGWGTTSVAGEASNTLQKASLTPVPLNECNVTIVTRTRKAITSTQLCAGDTKSDACQGDSGGPLQAQNIEGSLVWNLIGITSYGISCGGKYPGIYSRVSSFTDWVENIAWPNNLDRIPSS